MGSRRRSSSHSARVHVTPYLGMFSGSSGDLDVAELEAFLRPPTAHLPSQRPYTWSCSVASLDGKISFNDPGAGGSAEVALGHIVPEGRLADWRVLNAGWAYADAVLTSGAILRAEPDVRYRAAFPDLAELRDRFHTAHANGVRDQRMCPVNVVLTESGNLPLSHPILHDSEIESVVLTSKDGRKALLKRLEDQGLSESELESAHNTRIQALPQWKDVQHDSGQSRMVRETMQRHPRLYTYLCMRSVMHHLRVNLGIRFLDVSSGGNILSQLAMEKQLDEIRLTLTGQVVGATNLAGAERPSLFHFMGSSPVLASTFSHENNPTVEFQGIRAFGRQHLFIRGTMHYRH